MSNILDKFSLKGKVAWITGASYGLGLAYAKAYHEAGAKIVFNDYCFVTDAKNRCANDVDARNLLFSVWTVSLFACRRFVVQCGILCNLCFLERTTIDDN